MDEELDAAVKQARKNPGDTLKWTPHVDGKVYGASGKVTLSSGRVVEVSLRVDAREEGNVRVDKATIGPWNAIDDGEGFSTVGEAQRFAKAWLRAAQAEHTLDPRVPRKNPGFMEWFFGKGKKKKAAPRIGFDTRQEAEDDDRARGYSDAELTWFKYTQHDDGSWTSSLRPFPYVGDNGERLSETAENGADSDSLHASRVIKAFYRDYSLEDTKRMLENAPWSEVWALGARKNPSRRARKNPDNKLSSLDSCTRQYLETAMWASTDDNDVPLDKEFSITDFPSSEIEKARKACDDFCDNNDVSEIENDQVGHYLWLSRNCHGAGFFDIDRDDLQKAARKLGEVDIYVGDDGLLYFSR